jgi:hypothetical protein
MKIVLVVESISNLASGGRVVRYVTSVLKSNGHKVSIICKNPNNGTAEFNDFFVQENDVIFFEKIGKISSYLKHVLHTRNFILFQSVLRMISPDVIHFCSFQFFKSRYLIEYSSKLNVQLVLQPYTYNLFCAQGYSYDGHNVCPLCSSGNFAYSLYKGCLYPLKIPSIIFKKLVKNAATKSNVVISSNRYLDSILKNYGIGDDKIVRMPIPYEYILQNKSMIILSIMDSQLTLKDTSIY